MEVLGSLIEIRLGKQAWKNERSRRRLGSQTKGITPHDATVGINHTPYLLKVLAPLHPRSKVHGVRVG